MSELSGILKIESTSFIISLHFLKDKKRSFSNIEEIQSIFEEMEKNPFFNLMLEFPNKSKAIDFPTPPYHHSSFSDITDWEKYSDRSKTLPSLPENVKTIDQYINTFIKDKRSAFDVIEQQKSFTYTEKGNVSDIILLSSGLNIVFGEKGSGKSFFVNSIKEQNPNSFREITFSDYDKVKGLNDLWERYKKDKVISLNKVKKLDELLKVFNEDVNFKFNVGNKIDFNISRFKNDMEAYWKLGDAKDERKKILILNTTKIDDTLLINSVFNEFQDLNKILFELYGKISTSSYNGSLNKEFVSDFMEINIRDWINSNRINFFSFIAKFEKYIAKTFKIVDKPKIGIGKMTNNILESVTKYVASYNGLNSKIDSIVFEKELFKTEILGDTSRFGYSVKKRTKGYFVSNDDMKGIKPEDVMEKLEFLKELDKQEFKTYSTTVPSTIENIKLSDLFNIHFYSNLGNLLLYKPSTGQRDMIVLDSNLKRNDNIIIDEFCNTLDNKFVFEKVVKIMDSYEGIILATTHNPIISIIPKIKNYFYTQKDGDNFSIFNSDKGYSDELISLKDKTMKINTKKCLADIIEGTKPAFDLRKEKYGFN